MRSCAAGARCTRPLRPIAIATPETSDAACNMQRTEDSAIPHNGQPSHPPHLRKRTRHPTSSLGRGAGAERRRGGNHPPVGRRRGRRGRCGCRSGIHHTYSSQRAATRNRAACDQCCCAAGAFRRAIMALGCPICTVSAIRMRSLVCQQRGHSRWKQTPSRQRCTMDLRPRALPWAMQCCGMRHGSSCRHLLLTPLWHSRSARVRRLIRNRHGTHSAG
jgi:hypothetical protein